MSAYWTGVLSVPALVLAAAVAWLAFKVIGKVGERLLVGGLMTLGMAAPVARRAATASVVYGAKRSYMLAGGDVAILLVVGMDGDRVRTAADRLQPRVSLGGVRAAAKPGPRNRTTSISDDEYPDRPASMDDGSNR